MKKISVKLLITYIIFALVFSTFIFRIHTPNVTTDERHHVVNLLQEHKSFEDGNDKVVLLEDGDHSAIARINLIENAKNSIDIAYYTLHKGTVTDTFLGLVIEAADRGVKVNLLLDGMFHNLRRGMKDVIYTFAEHPNIELKLYEPFHLLKPWVWNNRLHDKLLIIDNQYAIIGGRNIGDRYFLKEEKTSYVKDRDVLIVNDMLYENSVIQEMNYYFTELWQHRYTKNPLKNLTDRKRKKGHEKKEELLEKLQKVKHQNVSYFNRSIKWQNIAMPVEQILFIHNPIQRLNKEPWVWLQINEFIKTAEHSIMMESPYIIPTKGMKKYITSTSVPNGEITLLTNSLASTPNPLAYSGYFRHIQDILRYGFDLNEYMGNSSIHSKTFLFDDQISMIGSFNIDARSTFLSTESMVIIKSDQFAQQVKNSMENRLKMSQAGTGSNCIESDGGFVCSLKKLLIKLLAVITNFYHHLL